MPKLLFADLTNEKLRRSLGGQVFTLPALNQGSDLYFGLRFTEEVYGAHVVDNPIVREIRVTIGQVDLRPEAGEFSLKVGDLSPVEGVNVTAAISYGASAEDIQTALNDLGAISGAVVTEDDESFLVTGVASDITVYSNSLRPMTFVRVSSYEVDGSTTQAIRLQRAPLAFADTYTQRVPDAPVISRVQAGGSDGDIAWNEVQKLTVPLDFQGSYQIKSADAIQRTALLGPPDTVETIAAAMNPRTDGETTVLGVADDEDGLFLVTQHPTEPAALIEFSGSMEGAGHDELLIAVFDAPAGDYWLTVPLDTAAMAEAFRDTDKLKVPMEIWVDVEDPDDDSIVRTLPVWRGEVTIHEKITHDDLGTAANIDYLTPPAPKEYTPFNSTQVITGQRHYSTAAGNGVHTTFTVAHNLASEEIDVRVRENTAGGALLIHGTDYTVSITDDNNLDVTVIGSYASPVPATGALIITVADLTAAATFAEDLEIEYEQVNGLSAIIDALSDRVTELEGRIGSGGDVVFSSVATSPAITLPFAPALWAATSSGQKKVRGGEETPLSTWFGNADFPRALGLRYGRLLPALHATSSSTLPNPLPAAAAEYQDTLYAAAADNDAFPGGGIQSGDFAACDGAKWYRVVRYSDSESTYYPVAHEIELFDIPVRAEELTLKSVLSLAIGFEGMVVATRSGEVATQRRRPRDKQSEVFYTFVLEAGIESGDETPGTPGRNLDAVDWSTTLMTADLTLTSYPRPHQYRYRLKRYLDGETDTLEAEKVTERLKAAATAPGSIPCRFRGRLIRFDTRDSVPEPAGLVLVRGLSVGWDGQDDPENVGLVTIG